MWDTLDEDTVQRVQDAVDGLWAAFKTAPSVPLVDEAVCQGVNVTIPRRVVEKA